MTDRVTPGDEAAVREILEWLARPPCNPDAPRALAAFHRLVAALAESRAREAGLRDGCEDLRTLLEGAEAALATAEHRRQAIANGAEATRYREALERWTRHSDGCAALRMVWRTVDGRPQCDCGLDSARAALGVGLPPADEPGPGSTET